MGTALQYFHHVLRTTIWPITTGVSYVYIIVVVPLLQGLIQIKKKRAETFEFGARVGGFAILSLF